MNIVADLWRHALPLVSLYLFQSNVAAYLLLTAFDLSLGLMLIVGTTRDRNDPTTVDAHSPARLAVGRRADARHRPRDRSGHRHLALFPILYAALLVFYDVRPDLAQRIFPKLWRETQ